MEEVLEVVFSKQPMSRLYSKDKWGKLRVVRQLPVSKDVSMGADEYPVLRVGSRYPSTTSEG
jgi:hypothetical protein